ncbi:MAG: exonuclease SbcCD subunit D [Thermoprotei archaeon]|nr:exonuclease SbcCD subunit D [Thermoprotei archaeon]
MSVRFIHFGDTHLSRTYPSSIAPERVKAFNSAFRYVIEKAIERDVDFIVHTGDLFDKVNPWPSVVNFVKTQLVSLDEHGIPFYVIRGNHDGGFDSEGVLRGCSIDLVRHPRVSVLEFIDPVYDSISHEHSRTPGFRDYLDSIRIVGMGYFGHNTERYLRRYIPQALRSDVDAYILLLHVFVEGYTAHPPGEPYVPLSSLEELPFAYIAVGHDHEYHPPLKLKGGGCIACSGSSEKWDFYEKDGKFFYVVTLRGGHVVSVKEENIPSPHLTKVILVESDTPRPPEWFAKQALNRIMEVIKSSDGKKLILRIKFKGELSKGTPSDIPLDVIYRSVERLRKSGELLYLDVSPPDLDIRLEDIKVKTEGLDIRGMLLDILGKEERADKAFEIFNYARNLFKDDENLTRDGNLKDQALKRLKRRILQLWDLSDLNGEWS